VQQLDLVGVRRERVASLDPDRGQHLGEGAVARQPRLGLHDPVECLPEADVVRDAGVHELTLQIPPRGLGRIPGRCERVDADAAAVLQPGVECLWVPSGSTERTSAYTRFVSDCST
jgi:hypothetical protein